MWSTNSSCEREFATASAQRRALWGGMRGRPRPQDRAEPRPETPVSPPVSWARTPRRKGGRMAPGAAGEADDDDGSGVSPGTSGDRGLSCLRAGPGTGGKARARGRGWGSECSRKAVEQGRCTPSLPHCTPQAASCVSLPPALSVPPGVPCWVVLTNPGQMAGEHTEKCPNADC